MLDEAKAEGVKACESRRSERDGNDAEEEGDLNEYSMESLFPLRGVTGENCGLEIGVIGE